MGHEELTVLIAEQSGVVARQQVFRAGLDDGYIRRRLRRRDWARIHAGVFVNHTGPITWEQRAWAGVLYYWPAVLSDESALQVEGLRRTGHQDGAIHVAVDHSRRVAGLVGVTVHRVRGLEPMVRPSLHPPRMRLEHALLRVASKQRRASDAIALIGDACQQWRTTADRLRNTLRDYPRMRHRGMLAQVLEDAAEGVYSVLEHRYLTKVERPHGLPTARRQRRVRPGRSSAYRDVEYLGLYTVVELDGRLGHEQANDRWDDMDRDVGSATMGDLTLRLSWQQVEDPCRTASAVGRILAARGWTGQLVACSRNCPVTGVWGDLQSPRDRESPQTKTHQAKGSGWRRAIA